MVAKNSIIYLISSLFNALVPFLLLPVLTRVLSQDEYGELALYQVVLSFFCVVIPLGIQSAVSRKYYDEDLTDYPSFIATVSFVPIFVLLFIAIISIFSESILYNFGIRLSWYWLALFNGLLFYFCQLRLSQWQIRFKANYFAFFQVGQSLLILVLTFLLLYVYELGADSRPYGQIIPFVFFALVSVYSLKKDGLLDFSNLNASHIVPSITFSFPLAIHSLGTMAIAFIDRYIINSNLSLADVAIYAVSFQLSSVFILFFDSINRSISPFLFDKLKKNDFFVKLKIIKITYGFIFLIIILGLPSVYIFSYLVPFILGGGYEESSSLIVVISSGNLFAGGYFLFVNYIFFSKKTSYITIITVLTFLITFLLMFYLVVDYELMGVAYSYLLGQAFRFVLTAILSFKVYNMPWLYPFTSKFK
jgi:O-antigen/teichoic acid export membrane protein